MMNAVDRHVHDAQEILNTWLLALSDALAFDLSQLQSVQGKHAAGVVRRAAPNIRLHFRETQILSRLLAEAHSFSELEEGQLERLAKLFALAKEISDFCVSVSILQANLRRSEFAGAFHAGCVQIESKGMKLLAAQSMAPNIIEELRASLPRKVDEVNLEVGHA